MEPQLYFPQFPIVLEGLLQTTEFLTVEDVAIELGVTGRTVRNLIKRGRFPNAHKIDPLSLKSTYQIPKSDLEKYIALQKG